MTGLLKIVKPNKSINSSNPGDWVFHSGFAVPKFHSDNIRQMTINNGDLTKTVFFPHGLSYVPDVKGYIGDDSGVSPLPRRRVIGLVGIDENFWITADATNIYIKYKGKQPWGHEDYYASDYWNTYYGNNLEFSVGRDSSNNIADGAFRFNSIQLLSGDSLISAKLYIGTDYKSGSGDIKFRTWGIDEDNTSSFSSGPMSRTKTDAVTSTTRSVPTNYGDTVEVDVKSQVEEIKSRAGWNNNNAIGFISNENNGDTGAIFGSAAGDYYYGTYLRLIKTGSTTINFRVIVFKDKIA